MIMHGIYNAQTVTKIVNAIQKMYKKEHEMKSYCQLDLTVSIIFGTDQNRNHYIMQ